MSDQSIPPAPKQKKWATKTKTGCHTCRRRRIKCDETKPICKRCSSANRYCDGYMYQDSIKRDFISQTSRPNVKDPVPMTYLVLEACEWRNTVIATYYMSRLLMYSDEAVMMRPLLGHPANSLTLATSLAMRLTAASVNDGNNYFPIRKYGTTHLWNSYHFWMAKALEAINHDLSNASEDLYNYLIERRVLARICDIMSTESVLGFTSWRSHLEGFLVLLACCSNPAQILGSDKKIWFGAQRVIGYAVMHNTVNPPHKHITNIYYIGEENLVAIFGSSSWVASPFPTYLFREVIKITKLRAAFVLKGGAKLPQTATLAAYAIFQQISKFDPHNWTETYNIPNIPEVPLTAQIFKLAVILYGLLTLPLPPSTGLVPRRKDQAVTSRDKKLLCSQLLQLLRDATKYKKCEVAMVWPTVVAGTALAGGSAADQQALINIMDVFKPGPGQNRSDRLIVDKLQQFWRSGKTQWDECWENDRFIF